MKRKLLSISTFFSCLLALNGQAQMIKGSIDHYSSKALYFHYFDEQEIMKTDTASTNASGQFEWKTNLLTPSIIAMSGNGFNYRNLYLWPGDTLHIKADGTDHQTFYNSLRFEGTNAIYSRFFVSLSQDSTIKSVGFGGNDYTLETAEFVRKIEQYFDAREDYKHRYFSSMPKNQNLHDFLLIDSIDNTYFKASAWWSYLQFKQGEEAEKFFSEYIEPYYQLFDDANHLISGNYRYFFNRYIRHQYDVLNKQHVASGNPNWHFRRYYEMLPDLMYTYLNVPLSKDLSYTVLSSLLQNFARLDETFTINSEHYIEPLYRILESPVTEAKFRRTLAESLDFKAQTDKGQPAMPFENMIDTQGTSVSLEAFRGKLLYIDLWASWCGPCIAEFPAGRILEKEFEDRPIAFLTISLDDREADWRQGMTQLTPPGQQFWISDGMRGNFAKTYKVTSIPRYLLLDAEGNFIRYGAPRPSDAETKALLNELLDQMETKPSLH